MGKEPLIKSTMSHVAVKFEMIARRIAQVVAAHGHVTGVASRLREVRLSHLSRTCATRYRVEVATLRCQAMQHSNRMGHVRQVPATLWRPWRHERSNLMQPKRHWPLRAVCYVRLFAKGMTIYFKAFLAPHPAKPSAWPCGT